MSFGIRYKENLSKLNQEKEYGLEEAVDLLHSFNHSKFDESVDIHFQINLKIVI